EDDPCGPRYHPTCGASRRCLSHCGDDGPAPLGSSGLDSPLARRVSRRSSESSPVMAGSQLIPTLYAASMAVRLPRRIAPSSEPTPHIDPRMLHISDAG